jgi:hypothetical protein
VKASRSSPIPVWIQYGVAFLFGIMATLMFRAALPGWARVSENSDFDAFYEPVARRILSGQGITQGDGAIGTRYPPGYPMILAGVFATAHALRIDEEVCSAAFTAGCVGLATALVLALARRCWRGQFVWLAPTGFATYPLVLWLTKQPNSEVPFVVPLYAAALFMFLTVERRSRSSAVMCGLLLGVATLIRPIAIGLGIVASVGILCIAKTVSVRARLVLAGLIVVGNLVAVAPWEYWVYRGTGRIILVSTGGMRSIRDGVSFAGRRKSFRQRVSVPSGVAAIVGDVEVEWGKGQLSTMPQLLRLMGLELRRRPIAFAELAATKALRSWFGTDSHRYELIVLCVQLVYLPLLGYSGLVAYRLGGLARSLAQLSCGALLYFWGMTMIALSIARYMVPAIGLAMTLLPAAAAKRSGDRVCCRTPLRK